MLDEEDRFEFELPHSHPGKLAKFLYERAEAFDFNKEKVSAILPFELIDDNGIMLMQCVHSLATQWKLGDRFIRLLDDACVFTSFLVDRIVTGYLWDKA